ncbi:EamA family transporter [Leucobacter sp. CSA2]|uniref:EamA family transporter n=1 Tax=Leucobacter edaphi TaxID=2796472 RepID=A0A934UWI6_9MICO|nr:EamA family transporter [Leucobacter edaphi]MBK0420576.1 EamA family transporter [Leucobacter edaphi]
MSAPANVLAPADVPAPRGTPSPRAGVLAILIACLLWGTTGTAATFAPEVGPLAIGAAALGIGGLLQAAIAIPALRRERGSLRARAGTVVAGAIGVAAYPLAFYSSMHLAGVAIGTVVSLGSAPIASGLLEGVLEGRRPGRSWLLAAALGIGGCALLCGAKLADEPAEAGGVVSGVLLGLLAGASYALYSWSAARLMGQGVSRAAAMGAVFGGGGALLMPVLLATGAPLLASPQAFAVGAYMAIVTMFIGYLLFGFGLTRVSASTATTLTLVEPAIAAVLAVLVVGERLLPISWLGMAGIAASLLVLVLTPAPRTPAAAVAPAGPTVPLASATPGTTGP